MKHNLRWRWAALPLVPVCAWAAGARPFEGPAPDAHAWLAQLPSTPRQFAAEVDDYLASLEKQGFSGVVLVAERGTVLLQKAYGYADRESRRRMTTSTGFDIGSIVKPITRAAIVRLDSEGKLSLSDGLRAHLAGVPPDKASITLQHVLDHKAGFPDIFGDDYAPATRDLVVRQTLEAPLISGPGEKFQYSNAGYSLLGAIIEKVSGRPYERYVYDEILAPAGAKRLGYLIPGWKPEELAVGYLAGKRWGTPLDKYWMEDGPSWNLRANGGMLSNVEELYGWYEALLSGRILSSEATARYREMVFRSGSLGQRVIGAAGGNGIFNSFYLNIDDVGLVFVLFTNASDMQAEQVFKPLRARIGGLTRVPRGSTPRGGFAQSPYKTRNVVLAIMDGVHYDRTFGDPEHALIPHLWNDLRPQGTYYTSFLNNSVTITLAGHSNVMTGTWQFMRNRGAVQTMPTLIHYLADEIGLKKDEAWVIFGKGYYAYSPETTFRAYKGSYEPGFVYGLGEVTYQDDHDVLDKVTEVMQADRPRFVFVNFGVTDHTAHSGNWEYHTGAVKNCDAVLYGLWNAIQGDPHYRDKTTLIITSDHGYMDDGVHDGFAEHGDASEGSRRIMLLMLGPDIKKGHVVASPAYHIDVAPTVGELLGFQTPLSAGEVLKESLLSYHQVNRKEARTERARRAVTQERLARLDLVKHFGDRVVSKHASSIAALGPSTESTMLLWGMLMAYDKSGEMRYLDLVREWVDGQGTARGEQALQAAFLASELSYRIRDRRQRERLIGIAEAGAHASIGELERRGAEGGSLQRFVVELILVAAVSELNRDERLWHRAAKVYLDHVQKRDHESARRHVMGLGPASGGRHTHRKEGELVEASGKVLPDLASLEAVSETSWYLLAAAFIRSHGLPYKGESLPDLPMLHAEVIYQTYLAVEQLPQPGDIWDDPLEAALNVAAIREARRRVTLRGKLYEGVDQLTAFDLGRLRPESAELLPPIAKLKQTIRERITQTNYNVQYGFPPYEDFDFSIDALRLYADRMQDDLATGLFLMAVDPHRRIPTEPFVKSPRLQE